MPKERFISYPCANPDSDDSLLLGWAGWDHREQASALSYADAYDAYLTAQRESRHLTEEDLIAGIPPCPPRGRGHRARS